MVLKKASIWIGELATSLGQDPAIGGMMRKIGMKEHEILAGTTISGDPSLSRRA